MYDCSLWQFFQFVYSVRLGDPINFCFCSFQLGRFVFKVWVQVWTGASNRPDSISNFIHQAIERRKQRCLNWWPANKVKTIYTAMRPYLKYRRICCYCCVWIFHHSFLYACDKWKSNKNNTALTMTMTTNKRVHNENNTHSQQIMSYLFLDWPYTRQWSRIVGLMTKQYFLNELSPIFQSNWLPATITP